MGGSADLVGRVPARQSTLDSMRNTAGLLNANSNDSFHSASLVDKLDRKLRKKLKKLFIGPHSYAMICIAAALVLMAAVQIVAVAWWPECEAGKTCHYTRKSQAEMFHDIAYEQVPALKAHAESTADFSELGRDAGAVDDRDCVGPWMAKLRAAVPTTTEPALIREVLVAMRLDTAFGHAAVGNLIETPIDFSATLDQVAACAESNLPLRAVMCSWLDEAGAINPELAPTLGAGNHTSALAYAVHTGLVLERLAEKAMYDREFRMQLADRYARQTLAIERDIIASMDDDFPVGREADWGISVDAKRKLLKFKLDKWASFLSPEWEGRILTVEGGDARTARGFQYLLAMNVLEAGYIDLYNEVDENADMAIALAASTTDVLPWGSDPGGNMELPYSKAWYDSYLAWNLNYVATFPSINYIPKLLIPSVLCSANDTVRHRWVLARAASLKATGALLNFPGARRRQASILSMDKEKRREAARVARRHADVPPPAEGTEHGSLHRLWSTLKAYDTHLLGGTSLMPNKWFHFYFTMVAWVTVAATGLGSEFVFGPPLISMLQNVPELKTSVWHLAQLAFSLMLTVAFVGKSPFGLPFLAFGLWKFGFPETVNELLRFYNWWHDLHEFSDQKTSTLSRKTKRRRCADAVAALINGFGLLLHHFATSFILTAVMMHFFPPTRGMVAACVVPILQHLLCLMKYIYRKVYIVLMLLLEAWFQWEIIANVPTWDSGKGIEITRIGRGVALTMLLAHWLYILAGLILLIYPPAKHAANEMIAEKLDELEEAERREERSLFNRWHDRQEERTHKAAAYKKAAAAVRRMKHVITSGRQVLKELKGVDEKMANEIARTIDRLGTDSGRHTFLETLGPVRETTLDHMGVAMEVMAARQISTPVPEDTSVPSVQKNVTFGENHVLADSASAESIATSLNTSGLTLSAVSPCCSASEASTRSRRGVGEESSRAACAFQIGAEAGWTGLGGKGPAGWSSGFARQKPTQLKSPGTVILRPAPRCTAHTPKLSSRHSSSLASLAETSEEVEAPPSALLAAHLAAVEPQEETAVELSSVTDAEKSRVLRAEEVAAESEVEIEWLRAQQRRSSRLADIDSLV